MEIWRRRVKTKWEKKMMVENDMVRKISRFQEREQKIGTLNLRHDGKRQSNGGKQRSYGGDRHCTLRKKVKKNNVTKGKERQDEWREEGRRRKDEGARRVDDQMRPMSTSVTITAEEKKAQEDVEEAGRPRITSSSSDLSPRDGING